jgi:hypothetical protein
VGRNCLAIQVLEKSTPMTDNQPVEILEGGLRVTVDMRDNTAKYWWTIASRGSDFRI